MQSPPGSRLVNLQVCRMTRLDLNPLLVYVMGLIEIARHAYKVGDITDTLEHIINPNGGREPASSSEKDTECVLAARVTAHS